MRKWTVRDRHGREIYITEERWKHITERHEELSGHLDDVLDTVRKGHRKQDAILPYKDIVNRMLSCLTSIRIHVVVRIFQVILTAL